MKDKNIILPFEGGGDFPAQFRVKYKEDEYYIRYRYSWLVVEKNDIEVFKFKLTSKFHDDGFWTDKETNVYLTLLSETIINNTWNELNLPAIEEAYLSPYYERGYYPKYSILNCRESHKHDSDCYNIVDAKDLDEESYQNLEKYYTEIRNSKKLN